MLTRILQLSGVYKTLVMLYLAVEQDRLKKMNIATHALYDESVLDLFMSVFQELRELFYIPS